MRFSAESLKAMGFPLKAKSSEATRTVWIENADGVTIFEGNPLMVAENFELMADISKAICGVVPQTSDTEEEAYRRGVHQALGCALHELLEKLKANPGFTIEDALDWLTNAAAVAGEMRHDKNEQKFLLHKLRERLA